MAFSLEQFRLDGKVAIVTGGATSIGAAIVRAFHAAGTRVVVADIDAESGTALAAALGANVVFQRTDITDDAETAAAHNQASEETGNQSNDNPPN